MTTTTTTTTVLDWPFPVVSDDFKNGSPQWREIDEESFNWFAECVPPRRYDWNGHVCGELQTSNSNGENIYLGCLRRRDGNTWRYFAKLLTIAEFDREYIEFKLP